MGMIEHFRMMSAYNAWANARLYEAAATLPDERYRADRGAFFRSVHGTLNHLLVTDRIWMHRFTGIGDVASRLDTILFDGFEDLARARAAEDARICAYLDSLDNAALGRSVLYRRVSTADMFEQPLAPALAHLFNHQTHHRGQVHAILTGLNERVPELDLLIYQRLTGSGGRQVAG